MFRYLKNVTATAFNRDQKGREHAGDLKGQRRIDDNKWWQLLTSKQGFDLKYCWTPSKSWKKFCFFWQIDLFWTFIGNKASPRS